MKTTVLIILTLLMVICLPSFGFNYIINFSGSGEINSVDQVIVQNLSQGTSVIVPGGNVLNLTEIVSSIDLPIEHKSGINIFPNPIQEKSKVTFNIIQSGYTQISVYGVDGKQIIGITKDLQFGEYSFQLSLPKGVYVIKILGNGFDYAAKVMSLASINSKPEILKLEFKNIEITKPQKSKNAETTLNYNIGDHLLYKGISSGYSTIVTDVPTQSKTINFNFISCIDAEGNSYPVVKIGNQIWMAENLRTRYYQNYEYINLVTGNSDWASLLTGAWSAYNNNNNNSPIYGLLYNWYAVKDDRKIAPVGWHVASDAEWTSLQNYLSANGYNYDESVTGNKVAKSLSANIDWTSYVGTGGPGSDWKKNNSSGFSALPGGQREYAGTFSGIGDYNYGMWWCSTEVNTFWAWNRILTYSNTYIDAGLANMQCGYSVRCVMDVPEIPTLTTSPASSITTSTAIFAGNITADGGVTITSTGFCWSLTPNPSKDGNFMTIGYLTIGLGAIETQINEFTENTTYYVRAWATNSVGTAYGNEIIFKTNSIPSITTTPISSLTSTSAKSGGNITSDGGLAITAKGICWSTEPNPTIYHYSNNVGSGTDTFESSMTGLVENTTYYVKAYATNEVGTAYGEEISFKTKTLPTISTTAITLITPFTATGGGEITYDGGDVIIERGVCWSSTDFPTIADNKTSDGTGEGIFISSLKGLTEGTHYLIKAYATNSVGTAYGDAINFLTKSTVKITTTAAEWITLNTATIGGNITDTGYSFISAYGVCWSTTPHPTVADFKSNEGSISGTVGYQSIINGLTQGTLYYYRAYAMNNDTVSYGNELSFTTALPKLATVSTIAVSDLTKKTVTSGGIMVSDGGAEVTVRGVCWSTSHNPTIDNSKIINDNYTQFFSYITELTPATLYYLRAFATNSVGTAYGNEIEFQTLSPTLPIISTTSILAVTSSKTNIEVNITSDGDAAITARGVCWSILPNPDLTNSFTSNEIGTGIFRTSLIGLTHSTKYYLRPYATNSVGTVYGNEINVTTTEIVTDADGYEYNTTRIGTQVWLTENLRTTKYRNGDLIGTTSNPNLDIYGSNVYKYQWPYNGNEAYVTTYGRLYTWHAANDSRQIAPVGYHVPSDAEWVTLYTYLGGTNLIGAAHKLRETGSVHWQYGSNSDATNETEFTALPAGYRFSKGDFSWLQWGTYFWSSNESATMYALGRYMYHDNGGIAQTAGAKNDGFAVRCIKD